MKRPLTLIGLLAMPLGALTVDALAHFAALGIILLTSPPGTPLFPFLFILTFAGFPFLLFTGILA